MLEKIIKKAKKIIAVGTIGLALTVGVYACTIKADVPEVDTGSIASDVIGVIDSYLDDDTTADDDDTTPPYDDNDTTIDDDTYNPCQDNKPPVLNVTNEFYVNGLKVDNPFDLHYGDLVDFGYYAEDDKEDITIEEILYAMNVNIDFDFYQEADTRIIDAGYNSFGIGYMYLFVRLMMSEDMLSENILSTKIVDECGEEGVACNYTFKIGEEL